MSFSFRFYEMKFNRNFRRLLDCEAAVYDIMEIIGDYLSKKVSDSKIQNLQVTADLIDPIDNPDFNPFVFIASNAASKIGETSLSSEDERGTVTIYRIPVASSFYLVGVSDTCARSIIYFTLFIRK